MSDKLRNCPFCGQQPLSAMLSSDTPTIECCYSIACEPTAEATIAAWNKRTDPVKAQLVEALKNLISMLEATEACLYSWNKSGSPVNTERGIAQAQKALAAAEADNGAH